MASSLITLGFINRLREAEFTTPRDLHDRVLQLVTSFFRDDHWVPGLLVYGKRGEPIVCEMLGSDSMGVPGVVMAACLRREAERTRCDAVSVAMPTTRFEAGTERPKTPNFYRLSTSSNSDGPLASSWRIRMKESGRCLKHLPVSEDDNLAEGEHLIAAHWALLFADCPITPEHIEGRGAYYRTTYVVPEGAVHDPAFKSY